MKKNYLIINPKNYVPYLPKLEEKLESLEKNSVSYQKEIHRDSRFAICRYRIRYNEQQYSLVYDPEKSKSATTDKKANTDPTILRCDSVQKILIQFLNDIGSTTLKTVEVKLIQTDVFPFEFNIHRDSQFRRLRQIAYLATVLISSSGIDGGQMQLFHSQNDMLGPFTLIEEIPTQKGSGYIVDEKPQLIFHGMKSATKVDESAHRAALLARFFE